MENTLAVSLPIRYSDMGLHIWCDLSSIFHTSRWTQCVSYSDLTLTMLHHAILETLTGNTWIRPAIREPSTRGRKGILVIRNLLDPRWLAGQTSRVLASLASTQRQSGSVMSRKYSRIKLHNIVIKLYINNHFVITTHQIYLSVRLFCWKSKLLAQ